ncbi:hypothetical protein [Salibacterium aidingense]|uniref:hypothetical protein n=1 Tax=Salibacterium aidingense TaxID=384933 RepID=UPI000404FCE2|nr:hypothetical protein [Salibacterium aidingense]
MDRFLQQMAARNHDQAIVALLILGARERKDPYLLKNIDINHIRKITLAKRAKNMIGTISQNKEQA